MDSQTIANSVIRILTPYIVESGSTLARSIGQIAAGLSGELYEQLRQYVSQDEKAERTFSLFENDPKTFASAFETVLLQQLEARNEVEPQLIRLIERFEQAASSQVHNKTQQMVAVHGSGAVASDGSVAAGERGYAAARDIIVQHFQPYMPPVPAESTSRQWQAQADYIKAAMKAYMDEIQKQLQTFAGAPEAPYKGLFYYEIADEQIFFGREKERNLLLARIRGKGKAHWLTVLHGSSGSGKTSLVNAGVIPPLLREGIVTLYVLPGRGVPYQGPDATIRKRILDAISASPPSNLSELTLHQFLQLASPELNGKPLVIFIDQFEDFFIHLTADARRQFITELVKCYDDERLPVKFVLSLRKEYFSDLYELQSELPTVFYNQLKIEPLSLEQAKQAVLSPAAQLGITYEPELVKTLLVDLGQGSIEPPQLQIVCNSLYEARHSNIITLSDYIDLDRAGGILAAHLARFMAGLGRKRPAAEKILEELITVEGTKITLSQEELEARVGMVTLEEVLGLLVGARLLRRDEYDGAPQYELAHEYLIKEIRLWISEEKLRIKEVQELLERELSNWRIFGTLINPDRLQIIEKRSQDTQLHLSPEAQDLIAKSREKQMLDEQEQLQIIQSAKVTSLDQLVMGIDHEISSPIASIRSNSQFLRRGVREMKEVLERLPGLLIEVGQNHTELPDFLQSLVPEARDVIRTQLSLYLEILSRQMDQCIRDERLWTILEEIDQISDELQQASEKMSNLVTALSSFAHLDEAKLKLTDLHTGIDTALLLLGYELKHHFKVRRQYTEDYLKIRGSPSQVVQLFTNVLMNCVEASQSPRPVGLDSMIEVKTSSDKLWGFVVISDNGIGIPQENIDKILKPGFTTKGSPHRGLGLSIAAQIVQRHNGTIEFNTEMQKGTSVTIKLPLTDMETIYEQQ
jgi:signal transduction histidine kinase